MTKLILSKDGESIVGLATPFLDRIKNDLGRASISRASTIEYSNTNQFWFCTILSTGEFKAFKTREEAVEWEIDIINNLLKEGKI